MPFRFTWEAGDKGRANNQAIDPRSQTVDQFARLIRGHTPGHAAQHVTVDVLQRHIDIWQYVRRVGDYIQQAVIDIHRVEVHQANPVEPFDLTERLQQLRQHGFAVDIHTPVGRVLSDYDQFAHARSDQLAGFRQNCSCGLLACLPRILGIAQKVHNRSQPSEIFK